MDEHYTHDDSVGPGMGVIVGVIAGVIVVLALLWFAWIGPTYYPTVIVPVQQPVATTTIEQPDVNIEVPPDVNINEGGRRWHGRFGRHHRPAAAGVCSDHAVTGISTFNDRSSE